MDADAGADDPYTTDCSSETSAAHPNAYSEFTIVNGELDYDSIVCVEKAPGLITLIIAYRYETFRFSFTFFSPIILVFSEWTEYSSCTTTCGEGSKTRTRTCIGGICSRAAEADLTEISICNERGCEYFINRSQDINNYFQVYLDGVHGKAVLDLYVETELKEEREIVTMVLPAIAAMEQYSLKVMFLAAINALRANSSKRRVVQAQLQKILMVFILLLGVKTVEFFIKRLNSIKMV